MLATSAECRVSGGRAAGDQIIRSGRVGLELDDEGTKYRHFGTFAVPVSWWPRRPARRVVRPLAIAAPTQCPFGRSRADQTTGVSVAQVRSLRRPAAASQLRVNPHRKAALRILRELPATSLGALQHRLQPIDAAHVAFLIRLAYGVPQLADAILEYPARNGWWIVPVPAHLFDSKLQAPSETPLRIRHPRDSSLVGVFFQDSVIA